MRRLLLGVAFWIVFSAIAVPLRGVRWDETLEWGQIIAGDIVYPEHHPLNRFLWSAYTLQHYSTVIWIWLFEDPWIVSAIRNVIVLAFGTSAIFLWSSYLTGRVSWGFAATALALQNVLTPFETTYPLEIWPYCFSDGPIGLGWALITLFLILARYWRAGFLMLALMPTVHLGQMPAVFLTVAVVSVVRWWMGEGQAIRRAIPFAAGGAMVCIALGVFISLNKIAAPVSGPYFSDADPWAIWSNYKEIWYHTTIRGGVQVFLHSHMALGMALILSVPMAVRALAARRYGDVWVGLSFFCFATAGAVWVAMALHTLLGPDVPFLVIGWMPYRLANHAPVLVFAMALGILSGDRAGRYCGIGVVLAGLVVNGLAPVFETVFGAKFFEAYLADGAWILYLLVGCSVGVLSSLKGLPVSFRIGWRSLCSASLVLLVFFHQFAVGLIVLGLIVFGCVSRAIVGRLLREESAHGSRWERAVLVGAASLAIVAVVWEEYRLRDEPPDAGFDVRFEISDFDRAVRDYFVEHNEENVMVVADNFDKFLQARIGQPVMANWMSGSLIIYTPGFGPPTQKVFLDIYGISFGESLDGLLPQQPAVWQATWSERTLSEWQGLGDEYDFRYVIAPDFVGVDLVEVLRLDGEVLYSVPRVGE